MKAWEFLATLLYQHSKSQTYSWSTFTSLSLSLHLLCTCLFPSTKSLLPSFLCIAVCTGFSPLWVTELKLHGSRVAGTDGSHIASMSAQLPLIDFLLLVDFLPSPVRSSRSTFLLSFLFLFLPLVDFLPSPSACSSFLSFLLTPLSAFPPFSSPLFLFPHSSQCSTVPHCHSSLLPIHPCLLVTPWPTQWNHPRLWSAGSGQPIRTAVH